MSLAQDLQQTIDVVKGVYAGGQAAVLPDVVKDFQTGLGLIPYNLEPGARLLAPVLTPVRNFIPRRKGYGKATEFKAVTNYNSARTPSWSSEGVSGGLVDVTTVDVLMPYKIQALKSRISFEGQYQSAGQVDMKALAVANLLRSFMIAEEDNLLFGNPTTGLTGASSGGTGGTAPSTGVTIGGAQAAPATLTATQVVVNTTGGGLGAFAAGFDFYYTVRTGPDYGFNFSTSVNTFTAESPISAIYTTAAIAAGTGANQIVVTPVTQQGAIGYVLYYKAHADTNFIRLPFSGRAVINTYTAGSVAAASVTGLSGNTSSDSRAYPGIIQQLLAANSGATVFQKNLNLNTSGNPLGLYMGSASAPSDIDTTFGLVWGAAKGDPDMILINQAEALVINRSLASTPFFVQPEGSPNQAVGNFRVSRLTNGVTGTLCDVRVHPTLPQGVMVMLSSKMPNWYPGSDIPSVWSSEWVYDYLELDYPPTDPNWPVEIRNNGALLCYLPLINAVLLGFSIS